MGLEYCKEPGDWRDSPFYVVIYEYTVKNVGMPSDMGTLIAYIVLFLFTWYVFTWTIRLVLSLVWPLLVVVAAFFLFRFLCTFQYEDLTDVFLEAITLVADAVVSVLEKLIELFSCMCM